MGKELKCIPIGYGLPFQILCVKCTSSPNFDKNVCILMEFSYFGNKDCKWNFNHNNVFILQLEAPIPSLDYLTKSSALTT